MLWCVYYVLHKLYFYYSFCSPLREFRLEERVLRVLPHKKRMRPSDGLNDVRKSRIVNEPWNDWGSDGIIETFLRRLFLIRSDLLGQSRLEMVWDWRIESLERRIVRIGCVWWRWNGVDKTKQCNPTQLRKQRLSRGIRCDIKTIKEKFLNSLPTFHRRKMVDNVQSVFL